MLSIQTADCVYRSTGDLFYVFFCSSVLTFIIFNDSVFHQLIFVLLFVIIFFPPSCDMCAYRVQRSSADLTMAIAFSVEMNRCWLELFHKFSFPWWKCVSIMNLPSLGAPLACKFDHNWVTLVFSCSKRIKNSTSVLSWAPAIMDTQPLPAKDNHTIYYFLRLIFRIWEIHKPKYGTQKNYLKSWHETNAHNLF